MDSYNIAVRFFQEGGLFMYPIMLVLAMGLAIAIERYIYLIQTQRKSYETWRTVMPLFGAGEFQKAETLIRKSKDATSHILAYGIDRLRSGRRRDDVGNAIEEGMMEIVPRLEKRTHYLATFANIATLLGLLGTIIGLIHAFTAVANANPAEKANLLSASISVAMNTTAFGLIVAIPLMLIHTVLQTKTSELVENLEMVAVKFSNLIANGATQVPAKAKVGTPPQALAQVQGGKA